MASASWPPRHAPPPAEGNAHQRAGHFFENDPALTPDTSDGVNRTLALLSDAGATVHRVTLPDLAQFLACSRVIMAAESFAIHRDGLARNLAGYGEAAVRRLVLGAGVGVADYLDAQRMRGLLAAAVGTALREHDALLTAISLGTAPSFASQCDAVAWPLQASPFNVSGHPAISVPVGLGGNGLPLAVQVVGRRFDEAGALRLARAVERLTGWPGASPGALNPPSSGHPPPATTRS